MEKLDLSKLGLPLVPQFDPAEFAKMKADSFNRSVGQLTGPHCPNCNDRGILAVAKEDGSVAFRDCECMKARKAYWKMERSGLAGVIRDMTFDRFEVRESWQKSLKARVEAYAKDPEGWLLLCGQVGGGKTHLCTAVCRQRLYAGDEVRYMPWREEIGKLKALSFDSEERSRTLSELKNAQILYIDDLFKTGKSADGTANPTAFDVSLAFEIINFRYINDRITLVSTEKNTPAAAADRRSHRQPHHGKGRPKHPFHRPERGPKLPPAECDGGVGAGRGKAEGRMPNAEC